MKLLAIDTSTLACTVGLCVDGEIIERYEEQPREHTRLLVPMVRSVLAEAGLDIAGLDAIALGNGPGSFIGLRIGASVAQGLGYAANLAIVPVSSMAAVAARAGQPGDLVVVAQDAHMQQAYLGLYDIDAGRLPRSQAAERLHDPAPIAELTDRLAVPAGAGFDRYPALLKTNRNRLEGAVEVRFPHAADVLSLAVEAFEAGKAVQPEDLTPAYIRRDVAAKPSQA